MKRNLTIGTRRSQLALWQANYVADALRRHDPELSVQLQHIVTQGDKILDVPLARIGGKGLFTTELERRLLDGTIDLAVHSLKDLPADVPDGLCLAAITARHHVHDAFVSNTYATLESLPAAPASAHRACAAEPSCSTPGRTWSSATFGVTSIRA